MKTIQFLIACLLISSITLANKEKTLKSKIKNVTVFLSTAQVQRTASLTIEAGLTELIFDGVSPYINTESIQAKGNGNFIILDVQYRIKQPEPIPPSNIVIPQKILQDIRLLSDSLSFINFDIDDLNNKKEVLELEKRVLLQNKFMQGNVDTIPELKQAMEYLRVQLNDINKELNVLKRENFKLTKISTRMSKRLTELNAYNKHVNPVKPQKPKHQVVVTVSSEVSTGGNMTINYIVTNAGWTPEYDIRVNGTNKPVTLVYKANVYQNTGEDWKNVKLKLSTIIPNASNVKPLLPVLYLNYYNPYAYNSRDDKARRGIALSAKSDAPACADLSYSEQEYSPALTSADYTQIQQTMTNVEYDIKLPYSINSDGKYHKVAVKNYKLKAEYYHYLVPRVDKQAYLIAKVTDYSTLDLLPAEASIYFEGTYVGKTNINTSMMQDTMELALGTDRGIVVERKKSKDEEEMKYELIGNNVVKKITYNIKIKNNKLSATHIIIEDQIPVSQNEDIKIKTIKTADANYNELNGMLKWKIDLSSKATKNLKFSYNIEYNRNKQLANIF